jgi:uracil-DNA glycosylase
MESEALANVPADWLEIILTDALLTILKLIGGKPVTPPVNKIFEFARLTKLADLKLIIIGQDPFPKKGDAHGLAFSCLTGIPASLKNIYKCLIKNKLINEMPTTGNLEFWAKQGVLLINRSLTTLIGKPNSHVGLWDDYTKTLVNTLSKRKPLIFMLWGNNARELREYIDEKSIIYEWTHPSPMAQSKQSFLLCPHFNDANKLLIKLGEEPINWNTEPPKSEIEQSFGLDAKTQVVFTDGSCYPNSSSPESRGGYAASFALGTMKDVIIYGNLDNSVAYATNQRAEGVAMLKVLEYLIEHIHEFETCIIVSDSEFWIKMFEQYMPNWAKHDKFDEKKNPDLTKKMYEAYVTLKDEYNKSIQFRHMKSHGKDKWQNKPEGSYEHFCYVNNQYVDELAGYARSELKPGNCVTSSATYEG